MSSTLAFASTRNPTPASAEDRAAIMANPGFGQYMTDHMVTATWTKGVGWHSGELTAYGPIQMSPAAAVLGRGGCGRSGPRPAPWRRRWW